MQKRQHIFAEGIVMKHTKTGKWIIGRNEKDKEAKRDRQMFRWTLSN